MRQSLRLFWTGWFFNMKQLSLSGFFMLNAARERARSSMSRSARG